MLRRNKEYERAFKESLAKANKKFGNVLKTIWDRYGVSPQETYMPFRDANKKSKFRVRNLDGCLF